MKNLLVLIVAVAIAIGVNGCRSKKEITNLAPEEEKTTTTNTVQCFDAVNDLPWTKLAAERFLTTKDESAEHPVFFKTDNIRIQTVFEVNFKNHRAFNITLPLLLEGQIVCKTFQIRDSETMAPQQQARMRIYSYKGEEVQEQQNTIRLDYHAATGLKAYVTLGDQVVLLEAIKYNNQVYYVTYNKNNSGKLKEKFETQE